MIKTLSDLDWAPFFTPGGRLSPYACSVDDRDRDAMTGGIPAMITLLSPGEPDPKNPVGYWLQVLPNARVAVAKIQAFRKRFLRSWGRELDGPWKREFQRRGAVHWHILAVPPHGLSDERYAHGGLPFRQWLSATWTDVLEIPDPVERAKHLLAGTGVDYAEGLRSTDPRRISVYFTKHGGAAPGEKEYQNRPPQEWIDAGSVGRWWGVWGLKPFRRTVEVEPADAVVAARTMRRWSRARQYFRQVRRGSVAQSKYPDVIGLAGAQLVEAMEKSQRRRTTVRGYQVRRGRGWVSVNDGPAFAGDVARAVALPRNETEDPLTRDPLVRAAERITLARLTREFQSATL